MSEDLKDRIATLADAMLDAGVRLNEARGSFEDALLASALRRASGKVAPAARTLGVHRNTLHNKLRSMQAQLRGRTSR